MIKYLFNRMNIILLGVCVFCSEPCDKSKNFVFQKNNLIYSIIKKLNQFNNKYFPEYI